MNMLTTNGIQQATEAVEQAKKKVNNRHRLGYHIMAPANWINDPNGLVQFKGEYHVFYQHHPYDENWGPMHWGHVKSLDLVNWEHLPIALAPEDACDKDGCFSGSAVDNDGELTLIYTGHHYIDKERDLFYQNQNIAVSTDGVHFKKVVENPVIEKPPADSSHHFRDPKVWKRGRDWYMIVGNSKNNIGRVILYRSPNLRNWEYIGVLAEGNEQLGYMWECPDFFELNGKHVLLMSPQGIKEAGDHFKNLFQTGYMIGEYEYDKNKFGHGEFIELDYGHDFYAVQTFLDDKNRRIAIGWMDMWESDMPTKKDGWCGALTLPRELTLSDDGKIKMVPVAEVTQLREKKLSAIENQTITSSYEMGVQGSMFEVEAVLEVTNAEKVELVLRGIENEATVLAYDKSTNKLRLDCSKSGKKKDGIRRVKLAASDQLKLRIFVDRSSIEVFINEGEATMTSRIYPTEPYRSVEFTSCSGKSLLKKATCWKLKDIWNEK